MWIRSAPPVYDSPVMTPLDTTIAPGSNPGSDRRAQEHATRPGTHRNARQQSAGFSSTAGGPRMLSASLLARRRPWRDPDAHAALGEYGFLVGHSIDCATLARAERLAQVWGVLTHEVLLSVGWVAPQQYAVALSRHLGVALATGAQLAQALQARDRAGPRATDLSPPLSSLGIATVQIMIDGRTVVILDATGASPDALYARMRLSGLPPVQIRLAAAAALRSMSLQKRSQRLLRRSIYGLAWSAPADSAIFGPNMHQILLPAAIFGSIGGGLLVAPQAAIALWTAILVLPFFAVVSLRVIALVHLIGATKARMARGAMGASIAQLAARIADADLPVYSVLVPLFREANMLPQLLAALSRLDYPAAKLDIKLILEAVDHETRDAVARLHLPANIEVIVVPDRTPRTKPKALNYALATASGTYVVIYDAEDEPEPGQLRDALAAFRAGAPRLACVQARLNIYNRDTNWLTRQFTIEYSALFDGILPCFAKLGLPLPLGGTSNHFRTDVLRAAGAWDPFNVTEDADLGVRLHRRGWRVGIVASTTWEEAPVRFSSWIRQRTRWLKGWMQTYIVHTRDQRLLWSQVGTKGFLGLHAFTGGLILSSLMHPVFYALIIAELLAGEVFGRPQSLMGASFWHLAIANLVIGFAASMLLGLLATWRRGFHNLALSTLTIPVYWLLISLAAYRALWQLVRDPFHWEKTEHGQPGVRNPRRRLRD